jgi:hypothetical protein
MTEEQHKQRVEGWDTLINGAKKYKRSGQVRSTILIVLLLLFSLIFRLLFGGFHVITIFGAVAIAVVTYNADRQWDYRIEKLEYIKQQDAQGLLTPDRIEELLREFT